MERPARKDQLARLDRRAIVDQQVPMVLGVLLVLLALLDHAVLTELLALSDQRATLVLPDPRVGLAHKARLEPRVILENVVLLVNVEKPAPLALPVLLVSADLLVQERITSGPSR